MFRIRFPSHNIYLEAFFFGDYTGISFPKRLGIVTHKASTINVCVGKSHLDFIFSLYIMLTRCYWPVSRG